MVEHIENWREELEVRLRATAIKSIVASAPDSYNAAKWVADGSWKQKGPGRPSKAERERERRIRERAAQKADDDSDKIIDLVTRKEGK